MTIKYENVYLNNTATVAGKYEKNGPLKDYFDLVYDDLYMGQKTFEQAEMKCQKKSLDILFTKTKTAKEKIDLFIGGDLMNQIAITNFTAKDLVLPYLGVFAACATSVEALIIGSSLIDHGDANNVVCTVSSHNMTAERQFRFPNEYGSPKPYRSTFTSTGACSVLISDVKSKIKVTNATIGRVMDSDCTDVYNMGEIMAIAAADTISNHLTSLSLNPSYYDLILTGDLGEYGAKILTEYLLKNNKINIKANYKDCGTMLYDLKKQPKVKAGGSGPVCSNLVTYSKIYKEMLAGKYKKVLLVATGAVFSPTTTFQKLTIPSIAHAVSLEVVS